MINLYCLGFFFLSFSVNIRVPLSKDFRKLRIISFTDKMYCSLVWGGAGVFGFCPPCPLWVGGCGALVDGMLAGGEGGCCPFCFSACCNLLISIKNEFSFFSSAMVCILFIYMVLAKKYIIYFLVMLYTV